MSDSSSRLRKWRRMAVATAAGPPDGEMPDAIEQDALISPAEVPLETLGQTRWIAGVGGPLDHECRRRNRFHFVELALQGLVP